MTLLETYDALLLDLDGTVYHGDHPIEGAQEAISAATERGVAVRYVTNNASRSPHTVAESLRALGITAADDQINTSAQAAAAVAAERTDEAAPVLIVGTEALADEVRARGRKPVWDNDADTPHALVQGFSKTIGWPELAEAALAIQAGAVWVSANSDPALPTERGLLPGNGAFVAALRAATGAEPFVAGKPERPLMQAATRAAQARRPLIVGDRLETDIAGAAAVGADALVVLTGVTGATELLAATGAQRPRYLAADLGGVFAEPAELEITERPGWTVTRTEDALAITGTGEPLDLLRTLCAVAWRAPGPAPNVHAGDATAAEALRQLGL